MLVPVCNLRTTTIICIIINIKIVEHFWSKVLKSLVNALFRYIGNDNQKLNVLEVKNVIQERSRWHIK